MRFKFFIGILWVIENKWEVKEFRSLGPSACQSESDPGPSSSYDSWGKNNFENVSVY